MPSVYTCSRCGYRYPPEKMLKSLFTDRRYCANLAACGDRLKRREREEAERKTRR